MKTIFLTLILSFSLSAYAGKYEKVVIQTSAICDECKEAIEGAFENKDGVVYSFLNLQNKKLKVKYNPDVISENEIREIVTKTGYDADDLKADKEAYSNLKKCCQTEGECH